ncbi:FAD-dependent oxidoreductase [Streptosporangium sp. NPDC001559]|uniref:FAD-dependent oxidoreductase n=1 Tax=Streptosporangium sp. NPDC001559 TaxID=3366187 RepID=UPI0036EFE80C
MPDVVVIGAGAVGAACAYYAARAGLDTLVVDRGSVAAGTTGAGEGNVLVSDKTPGPELALALLSRDLWLGLAAEGGDGGFEYEPKGGLVVARTSRELTVLIALAAAQARQGTEHVVVPPDALGDHEPHLADGLAGGVLYPQDAQVQPALAAADQFFNARARASRPVLQASLELSAHHGAIVFFAAFHARRRAYRFHGTSVNRPPGMP